MGSQLAVRAQIAIALCALASRAHADPKKDAQQHISRSAAFFQDSKFAEALDELLLAYSLDPQPGLLYSIGQVHVKLNMCDRAIDWYKRFLDTKPAAKPSQAAKEAIAACEKTLASQPAKPVEPEGKPADAKLETRVDAKPETRVDAKPETRVETKPESPPHVEPPPPQHVEPPPPSEPGTIAPVPPADNSSPSWYSDVVLDALAVGGVASLAVGGIYYSKAHSDYDSADHAATYAAHHSLIDSGQSAQTISIVATAAGGVLVAGAIVRYVVSDRKSEPSVAVAPTRGGAAITWSGRW